MGFKPARRAWAARPAGEVSAADLIVHLGREGASVWMRAWIEGWRARGDDGAAAVADFLGALTALLRVPADAPRFNGRAYVEEVEDCLDALARAHPVAFVDGVASRPALRERFDVLAVIGRVRTPRTTQWLVHALAGASGSNRWVALNALLARHDPTAKSRLLALLADPDHLVRFTAADGLRRWGDAGAVEPLLAYREHAQIGGRERALDAIESICDRTGAPLPTGHPGRRLTAIDAPPGDALRPNVSTSLVVARGDALTDSVVAPCAGVICGLDFDAAGGLERIVIRRPAHDGSAQH